MSKSLPQQPSLEHLKNEAKARLRQLREGSPGAKLAEAQLDIARGYGFPSWAKLKRFVEGFADRRMALFAFIRAGDRSGVSHVLDENPSLIHALDPNSFGMPVIATAAQRNDRPMIELLLSRGADIDARSDWWAGTFGALDFANDEISAFLLQHGATLTPHAAARLGMADALRGMIDHDPSVVLERGGDGQFPLHFAKTPEVVDILLDAGADIDARDIDHEGTAAQTRIQDHEVLRRLVERGAATDIFMAIVLDDLERVKSYVSSDPGCLERSVSEPGNPLIPQAPGAHVYTYTLGFVRPIQVAIDFERWTIFDFLLPRLSAPGQLLAACWKGDRELGGRLLRKHPDTTVGGVLLPDAARNCRAQSVAVMLEIGLDPDVQDGEGFTAIHWAAFHGRPDIAEILLPYRPNLGTINGYGGTLMNTLCYGSLYGRKRAEGNYPRTAELLIRAGAKVPKKASGSAETVATLRRYGAV